jgi:hypothetical protein
MKEPPTALIHVQAQQSAGLRPVVRRNNMYLGEGIAVGMRITAHPPHRSERARFRHSAPTLGE